MIARTTKGSALPPQTTVLQVQVVGQRGVAPDGTPNHRGVEMTTGGALKLALPVAAAAGAGGAPSGAATGDLGGTYPGPTVTSGAHLGAATVPNSALQSSVALHADKLSVFAATSSAELAGVLSDETGTGVAVFNDSPALITPDLGVPSAIDLTHATNVPGTIPTLRSGTDVFDGSGNCTISGAVGSSIVLAQYFNGSAPTIPIYNDAFISDGWTAIVHGDAGRQFSWISM